MSETGAGQGPVERMVMQRTHATLAHGWYWVLYELSDDTLTEPQPALWDGHQWRSVGWSGQPLHGALVLEPCQPPRPTNLVRLCDA